MAVVIVIRNWDEFQHYKDRDPPWVKLHRNLLTSEPWMKGTNLSRLVQTTCILLAPRFGNKTPCDPETIRKAGGIDGSNTDIMAAISHLVEYNFLDIQEVAEPEKKSAIRLLASCTSEAEAEAEAEADPECSAGGPPRTQIASTALAVPRGTQSRKPDPEWLDAFKAVYPRRAGDPNWRGAVRAGSARLQQGRTVEQFIEGAKRYAVYLAAKGDLDTEFVMQASRFLGPSEPFMQDWEPPKSKAVRQQDQNIAASQQWLRQGAHEHR